jgi:hypothetical protein
MSTWRVVEVSLLSQNDKDHTNVAFLDDHLILYETLRSKDSNKWKVTIQEEYNLFMINCILKDYKSVGYKCMFHTKRYVSNEIERYKVRLLAKIHFQMVGMDFNKIFAPMAKFITIK